MTNATSINRAVRRRRCHLAAVLAVLALGGAVVAHHLPPDHMGIGAMVLCLAVLPAVAVAVAVAVARIAGGLLPRLRAIIVGPWPPSRLLANPPLPRARASPVATVVLML